MYITWLSSLTPHPPPLPSTLLPSSSASPAFPPHYPPTLLIYLPCLPTTLPSHPPHPPPLPSHHTTLPSSSSTSPAFPPHYPPTLLIHLPCLPHYPSTLPFLPHALQLSHLLILTQPISPSLPTPPHGSLILPLNQTLSSTSHPNPLTLLVYIYPSHSSSSTPHPIYPSSHPSHTLHQPTCTCKTMGWSNAYFFPPRIHWSGAVCL